MPLLNLDIDVLTLIILYLPINRGSRNDILHFAYTCKSLYNLAQPHVVKIFDEDIPSTNYDLFKRTLDENLEYGKDIKTFSFRVKDPSREHEIVNVIQRFPNLQKLKCGSLLQSTRLTPIILSPSSSVRSNLQELVLCEHRPSTQELFELAALPTLYYFRTSFGSSKTVMFEPDKDKIGRNSVLLSLSIPKLHIEVFDKLLQCTSSLRSLNCSIPIPGLLEPVQSTHRRTRAEPVRIPYVLSPQSFMPALTLLSQTLTSLSIHSTGQLWDKYDGTRLDFSNFPILKNFHVSPLCFFSPISLGFSRDGLYKLLPPSLEILKVSC